MTIHLGFWQMVVVAALLMKLCVAASYFSSDEDDQGMFQLMGVAFWFLILYFGGFFS
jgi:hypothetical protein